MNGNGKRVGALFVMLMLVSLFQLLPVAWAQETVSQSPNSAAAQNGVVPTEAHLSAAEPRDATLRNGNYVLQKGDDLTVKVFGVPELDETVKVRPDGKISVDLLPDAQAAGLTTEELESVLTNSYKPYYRDPKISVIVRSFANQKVYVGGEVGQPGIISLNGDMTALAAIMLAGGFRPTAKMNSVILVRNDGHNAAISQKLNLQAVLNKGQADTLLQPFDVVYVPRSAIARVDKFVDQYIRQVVPATMTAGFNYIWGSSQVVTTPH